MSYGSKFTASEPTKIGVIGMGYADGLSTHLSNKGYVIINGYNCPIIGQICMCMFMVKLPQNSAINVNDMATIISPDNTPGMTIKEMGKLTQQNPREIMTHFSERVTRIYLN